MLTGAGGSLRSSATGIEKAGRSALEWPEAEAMAADGVTKSEIARRLGINRRTAAKLVEARATLARAHGGEAVELFLRLVDTSDDDVAIKQSPHWPSARRRSRPRRRPRGQATMTTAGPLAVVVPSFDVTVPSIMSMFARRSCGAPYDPRPAKKIIRGLHACLPLAPAAGATTDRVSLSGAVVVVGVSAGHARRR